MYVCMYVCMTVVFQLFLSVFLSLYSQKVYCFKMTFQDPNFNVRTFQAWKMKFISKIPQLSRFSLTRTNPAGKGTVFPEEAQNHGSL